MASATLVPPDLSVIQVSRASGQPLRVLYQRNLGRTTRSTPVPTSSSSARTAPGQHWMLNGGLARGHCTGGFNGWLRDGALVPLSPVNGREVDEAW